MIINKLFFSAFILTLMLNCNKKSDGILVDNQQEMKGVIIDTASVFNNDEIKESQNNVINRGDVESFNKLILHYGNLSNYKELQVYAIIMADKYNNGAACSQVFMNMVALNSQNEYYELIDFLKLNEKDKLTALKYLEKGVKLNDINCASILSEIYRKGIGVKKDLKKAEEIKKQIEKM